MTKKNPRLLILLASAWAERNVIHSGLLGKLLNLDVSIHVLVRQKPDQKDIESNPVLSQVASINEFVIPPRRIHIFGESLVNSIIRSSFNRRFNNLSYPIFKRWESRNLTLLQQLRTQLIELGGGIGKNESLLNYLMILKNYLYHVGNDLSQVQNQIMDINPDLLWSTGCISPLESPYNLVTQDIGIPRVTSILSFDNITSRGVLPLFNYYILWNHRMQQELLRFYPDVDLSHAFVTGTPQFDFHRNINSFYQRDETLAMLKLPSNSRYFLYGAGPQDLMPFEPQIVTKLSEQMSSDPILKDYWLVVRLHPLDTASRWMLSSEEKVLISHPWDIQDQSNKSNIDQNRLLSTLAHAEACINIASTISLDAAILDRPVISMDFSNLEDYRNVAIFEAYQTEHYKPLIDSGGIQLAYSWSEIIDFMHQSITNPQKYAVNRAQMVNEICGQVDGNATNRVIDVLQILINRHSEQSSSFMRGKNS